MYICAVCINESVYFFNIFHIFRTALIALVSGGWQLVALFLERVWRFMRLSV